MLWKDINEEKFMLIGWTKFKKVLKGSIKKSWKFLTGNEVDCREKNLLLTFLILGFVC